jgi:hypothetical protein
MFIGFIVGSGIFIFTRVLSFHLLLNTSQIPQYT